MLIIRGVLVIMVTMMTVMKTFNKTKQKMMEGSYIFCRYTII
jgi:hypothetical protein